MKSTVTANMPPPSHIFKYSPFHSPRRVLWYVDALRVQHCYHRPLNLLGYFCGDEVNSGLAGCKTIKDEGSLQRHVQSNVWGEKNGESKYDKGSPYSTNTQGWGEWPAATSKSNCNILGPVPPRKRWLLPHFEGTQSIRTYSSRTSLKLMILASPEFEGWHTHLVG